MPSLDCVDSRSNRMLTAYFGYKNDNGVSNSVPYDNNKNYLPLDVTNQRPTPFMLGNNRFQVGIDFTAGQTVYGKLNPANNPVREVRATSSSPRCRARPRAPMSASSVPTTCCSDCGRATSTTPATPRWSH